MSSPQEVTFESRMREACENLGFSSVPSICSLKEAYEKHDRFYHNLRHIEDCLAVAETLGNSDAKITLALCYHDAVYDSRAKDNEKRSAEWARRDLKNLGAATKLCDGVVRLILATAHRTPPIADDENLIVGIDLSILGQSDRYAAAVRQEYGWVSDEDWRQGRGQFLRSMLARVNLFSTKEMRNRFEHAARANLERELRGLENEHSVECPSKEMPYTVSRVI